MSAGGHSIRLEQHTKKGRPTWSCRAWCLCGGFEVIGQPLVVAAGIRAHKVKVAGE